MPSGASLRVMSATPQAGLGDALAGLDDATAAWQERVVRALIEVRLRVAAAREQAGEHRFGMREPEVRSAGCRVCHSGHDESGGSYARGAPPHRYDQVMLMKFALFGKYIEVYPDTLEPIAHPDMSLAGDFDWSGTPMKSRRPPGSTEIVATRPVNHRARYATVTDFADSQRLEVVLDELPPPHRSSGGSISPARSQRDDAEPRALVARRGRRDYRIFDR